MLIAYTFSADSILEIKQKTVHWYEVFAPGIGLNCADVI